MKPGSQKFMPKSCHRKKMEKYVILVQNLVILFKMTLLFIIRSFYLVYLSTNEKNILEHNFVLQMALHGIEISMPERPASLKIN
jgi:hypothetical protein